MAEALLLSKLRIPSVRPERVPRPHLLARLDEGLQRRVSLLCAPAGYGKSTLLADWSRSQPRPVAWLSLDAGDNDLARFLAYLGAALDSAHAGAAIPIPSPGPDRHGPWPTHLFTALVNHLTNLSHPLALVLDDYHHIGAHRVHRAVAFLVEHLPPQVHLYLATRMDPPFPLAQLRARGQLLELRTRDLRFSEPEVSRFLTKVTGSAIPPAAAATLATRTEGWPAALQLAGLSLRGRSPKEMTRFVRSFSGAHPHVADYLAGDVLDQQPGAVRRFLLETAVLERMCAPLCAAVMGDEPAAARHWQRQIEVLEQQNLLVLPLDEERQWYRYHHLFADLLRRRLQQEHPHRVPELHRRAGRWYETEGMLTDAIHHAFMAADADWAEALIRRAALPVLLQGRSATLYRWLNRLGASRVAASPILTLLMSWAHLAEGDISAAAGWLRSLPEGQVPPDFLPLFCLAQAVLHWFQGDPGAAQDQARCALAAPTPPDSASAGPGGTGDGAAHPATGERDEGLHRTGTAVRLLAATVLGETLKLGGKVRKAVAAFQQGLEAVQGPDLETGWASLVGNLEEKLALLLYEQNDLQGAEQHMQRGLTLARQTRNTQFEAAAYGVLALIRQAQGRPAAAEEAMERACAITERRGLAHEQAYYEAARVRLWIAQGHREGPAAWLSRQPPTTGLPPQIAGAPAVVRDYVAFARVRALLALRSPQRALVEAQSFGREAAAAGQMGTWIEATALAALALHHLGRELEARNTLSQALKPAAAEGHVRTFVDLGPPMIRLLQDFLQREDTTGGEAARSHALRLLAAVPGAEGAVTGGAFTTASTPGTPDTASAGVTTAPGTPGTPLAMIEPLTSREREVLALLAQGLRNREIAARLVVTVGTVKRHVSNICNKVGAASRTQAIIRAQELGLLPTARELHGDGTGPP